MNLHFVVFFKNGSSTFKVTWQIWYEIVKSNYNVILCTHYYNFLLQADAEGNISRNDLNKLKESMNAKIQFSDSMKQNYASQLVKTNEIRTSYYYEKLPTVINKLQDLEKTRIELIRTGILDCLAKEREVSTY